MIGDTWFGNLDFHLLLLRPSYLVRTNVEVLRLPMHGVSRIVVFLAPHLVVVC